MNFNTSPIAFYPSRAAQVWRTWFAQRKISVICGNDILPFYIIDSGSAPSAGELYEPNTDTKVADITLSPYLLEHDIVVDGQSRHIWIYQGGTAGVFGYTNPGYYYLKIGGWYSDIFSIGDLPAEYTEVSWQFFDDIITADGTPISKHIKYKQIFDVPIWHPSYGIEEEGKTNNGIFFAMQQTTKKTSGFSTIVNEAQVDCLNLTRMADNITIKTCINGVTKTMQTNQFEITSKWESDDIASIDCQFDLFSIVRKYQQSNVEPEPLPIPVPPPPPSNYYIKGKASGSAIHLYINGTDTTIPVYNGSFEYGYDTPISSILTWKNTHTYDAPTDSTPLLSGVTNITQIDFSESDGLRNATFVSLFGMSNCDKVDFTNCTLENVTNANGFLGRCTKLGQVLIDDATFASVKMCHRMFSDCESLTYLSLPKATISYAHGALDGTTIIDHWSIYDGCKNLDTIRMPLCDFAHVLNTGSMFRRCEKLREILMPLATFADATHFDEMFSGADYVSHTLDFASVFPSCTASPTSAGYMFYDSVIETADLSSINLTSCTNYAWFCKDSQMHSLTMLAAQFGNAEELNNAFENCELTSTTTNLLATLSFANATNVASMFKGCGIYHGSGSLSLTAATFASVTNAESMFEESKFANLYLSNASFNSVTNANRMFFGCNAIVIDMSGALFTPVSSTNSIFLNCTKMTTLHVPNSASWPLSFSMAQSASLDVNTMTEIAGWCKYLGTGASQSITVNGTAKSGWLADVAKAAIYNAAVSTLSSKNWVVN